MENLKLSIANPFIGYFKAIQTNGYSTGGSFPIFLKDRLGSKFSLNIRPDYFDYYLRRLEKTDINDWFFYEMQTDLIEFEINNLYAKEDSRIQFVVDIIEAKYGIWTNFDDISCICC